MVHQEIGSARMGGWGAAGLGRLVVGWRKRSGGGRVGSAAEMFVLVGGGGETRICGIHWERD